MTDKQQYIAGQIEELGRVLQLDQSNNCFHSRAELLSELQQRVAELRAEEPHS